jgi:hypothetical protein
MKSKPLCSNRPQEVDGSMRLSVHKSIQERLDEAKKNETELRPV